MARRLRAGSRLRPMVLLPLSAFREANAEALIRRTPDISGATMVGHEILIGRALGARAFARAWPLSSEVENTHAAWPDAEPLGLPTNCFQTTGVASS